MLAHQIPMSQWQPTRSKLKSEGEDQRSVDDVLQAQDFNSSDLHGLDVRRGNLLLDNFKKAVISTMFDVPSGNRDAKPTEFTIPGSRCRILYSVIRSPLQHPPAHPYHLSPFAVVHKIPSNAESESVFYNSDAFIEEYDQVQRHGCGIYSAWNYCGCVG